MGHLGGFGIDWDIILELYANSREQLPLYGKGKLLCMLLVLWQLTKQKKCAVYMA